MILILTGKILHDMKRLALYLGLASVLVVSCSIQEEDFKTPQQDDVIYYASFEQPAEEGTRVYANEDLLLRWTSDDRVSIFGKITYNQQYEFLGETGDNSGGFSKVDGAEYVTGNPIPHTVSVYPYQEGTKISEKEVLTLTLPAKQHYAEKTFGLGANTMVSVSEDNVLQYKSVGGFLRLSLYGEGVTVSSITLKGNNGEKLAGKATVTMPIDGTPTVVMADDATDAITIVCDVPVILGATAEESVDFWFVVPPVTFGKGFTVTVSGNRGVYEKSTEKTLTIERNNLSKMAPIEVELSQPNNAIYYTSSDGEVITPYNPEAFGVDIVSNEFINGIGVITFSDDLTQIGNEAFAECRSLASITIPDCVISIGEGAFAGCRALDGITLPDNLHSIEKSAFFECSSLASLTIPDGATSIGVDAFYHCSGLTSITIPDSVTWIGEFAFDGCSSLTSIKLPSGLTSVERCVFWNCPSLTSISIPDGVTSIGPSAFQECPSLSDITLPNGLTSIGGQAFEACTNLANIVIPGNVTSIGRRAFHDCSSFTSISIPDSVTSIGEGVFGGCSSLVSFSGKYASADGLFLVDSGLIIAVAVGGIGEDITIPAEVTRIGPGAFRGCKTLISITIPDSVTGIGEEAFSDCPNLSGISIPNGVTSIENSLFLNCSSLVRISIPDSVTSIGGNAFNGCSSLASITIPDNVTWIGGAVFANCSSLASVNIPDGVTSIEYMAFYKCTSLTSISIPNSVTSIGLYAFNGCSSLTDVTIPKGVTRIDSMAFFDCINLTSITVLPTTPPQGGGWMFDNTNNCPIYVLAPSVDTYKSAYGWRDYADRILPIGV